MTSIAESENTCPTPGCLVPSLACYRGEDDFRNCKFWKQGDFANLPAESNSTSQESELSLPWTGSAFGTVDMPFVSARTNTQIIGILGPYNAGKTTILGAWYLLLGRGMMIPGHDFSGSYTLAGWESVAQSLRWDGPKSPLFPVHTASGAGRQPGTLHFAFRNHAGKLGDFLFADTPGEWFSQWAVDRDAEAAAGARWVAKHSNVFLLIADSESLSGPERGTARNEFKLLAKRLGNECRRKRVALVWSKSDRRVPAEIKTAVRDSVKAAAPHYEEFSISVMPPKAPSTKNSLTAFADLLSWVLKASTDAVVLPRRPSFAPYQMFNYGLADAR